ncbi:DUF3124 domain-containing protein [Flavobacteriaceae bacterium F89]|uniref:DUF3124 domain-containing protein n=1 Tax=Cerina litoralis TaxID=2874477 RepID=A0AAE3EXZ6_9FLAO|nr:DUF3124 domain-containing protein [Cerina litoralis]MCG2462333.1 DUF3124 domain-containing protein [Cerina litoralis]
MKQIISLLLMFFLVLSCRENGPTNLPHKENFKNRTIDLGTLDSLESGKTYLSVYSRIYSLSEQKTHNLTVTASIRNTSLSDTVYISKAEYYNTHGKPLRSYLDHPIYLAPLETVEIVIDEIDQEGGTGANFIFGWEKEPNSSDPLFEGVMISTYGTQGLSFTTQGKRLE